MSDPTAGSQQTLDAPPPEVLASARKSGDADASGKRPPPDPRDTPTLESAYEQYHEFVWRNLLRLGVPVQQADDAVADCFLVLAKRLHEFEGKSSLKTWIFAIVYNVARGVRRDLGRSIERHQPLYEVESAPNGYSSPEVLSDAARQLHHLLAQLDEEKRVVFVMAELEGMTAPEIAAALQLKVPTVYSRIRLARERLQQAISSLEETP